MWLIRRLIEQQRRVLPVHNPLAARGRHHRPKSSVKEEREEVDEWLNELKSP